MFDITFTSIFFDLQDMRYSHAIVVRIPSKIKFDDKKLSKSVDLIAARKEQEDLNETLREVRSIYH